MEFNPIKRKELIVWLYSFKQMKTIRKYGIVHYMSHRLKYVVLYVNEAQVTETMKQLERYHFVRQVELSPRDTIDMTFKDAIPNRKDPDLKNKANEVMPEEPKGDRFLKTLAASLEASGVK